MLMDLIKTRRSIRKYTAQQIRREDLETILETGNYAPSAGGGQQSMMVAVLDRRLTRKIGPLNMSRKRCFFSPIKGKRFVRSF